MIGLGAAAVVLVGALIAVGRRAAEPVRDGGRRRPGRDRPLGDART